MSANGYRAAGLAMLVLATHSLAGPKKDAIQTDTKILLENLRSPTGGIPEALAFVQAGKVTIPALVEATADGEARVRGLGCFALGELQTPSEVVVKALLARLDDQDPEVRYLAARALGSLKQVPSDVVARLEVMRQTDSNYAARDGADEALLAITGSAPTPRQSIEALLKALKSAKAQEREEALSGIGRLALARPEVAGQDEVLRAVADRLLNDDYFQARSSAALAMVRIGKAPPFIIEALVKAVDDGDPRVRGMAIGALAKFGSRSAPALPRLKALAADATNPALAQLAKMAIQKVSAK